MKPAKSCSSAPAEQQEGRVVEAEKILRKVLDKLGAKPSFERAVTLGLLGRCFARGRRPDIAAQWHQDAISVLDQLDQDEDVKRSRCARLFDLADALSDQGLYAEARKAYGDGLELAKDLGDVTGQGVVLAQLGNLAMLLGDFKEAEKRYKLALALFQQLGDPAREAVSWHQLGLVFQEESNWDEAERHYRESARIHEEQGMMSGQNSAAGAWHQLAVVSELAGKPEAAEMWFRKVIQVCRESNDHADLSLSLHNLAVLFFRSYPAV